MDSFMCFQARSSSINFSVFLQLRFDLDLDRKISRDGNKRAKLNTEMMGIFIERLQTNGQGTARAIGLNSIETGAE
jgi:hypothetical protein